MRSRRIGRNLARARSFRHAKDHRPHPNLFGVAPRTNYNTRFAPMTPNPALGVVFHWLGGLASGSFYVPFRGCSRWSWETYWLVGGVFSWILVPWLLGLVMTNDLTAVLSAAARPHHLLVLFLGPALGTRRPHLRPHHALPRHVSRHGHGLGYCAAFGTLMPPIFDGDFAPPMFGTLSGRHSPRRGRLSRRHRLRRQGGHLQGKGDELRAEKKPSSRNSTSEKASWSPPSRA